MPSILPIDIARLTSHARGVANGTSDLIITFCNSPYRDVFKNWLVALRRSCELPVLVLATDEAMASELEQQQVPVFLIRSDQKLDTLWAIRANVMYGLVAAGFNVTHSDVDAVWLRNPLRMLAQIDADIVSSQGTLFPPKCHAAWNFVLCYGFIQFRATPVVTRLLLEFAEATAAEGRRFDDQQSLNESLLEHDIDWSVKSPYRIPFRETSFTCSPEPILGECVGWGGRLRVSIIPHAIVQRLPNSIDDSAQLYVSHPLSPKRALEKAAVLRELGVWFVDSIDMEHRAYGPVPHDLA